MLRLLISLALLACATSPVRADSGLTGQVAAAYMPRFEDAGLHAIAHERVTEVSACADCLTHDLIRAGTAEVLGLNAGVADPIAGIIGQWRGSSAHDAILSDQQWGRIGCAERVVAGVHYFACVLAAGPLPVTASAPTPPASPPPDSTAPTVNLLPDTAMP